ncbi:threonine/serine exporter family protein [Bacillus sp. REN16]|uniref:threonine/serine exporter family protein n=1 Tax=Bacillus sp. REN16 TaxID=2887296 RepID=UPI001E293096|nr:threonine/serine exporter family protein [Bacillus sp. REN16]MCC3356367.1 threonine/serine exporter family protein [Bacillus sp. REN16]
MLAHLITSLIASSTFGIIFNVPKKSLLKCGLVGMIGWMLYIYLFLEGVDAVYATLAASVLVAIISHIFAKVYKNPVIIYSIVGIIPLVPGGISYDAMRKFVENDYSTALPLAARAFMISGAIAFGLVISEVLNQLIIRRKKRV